MSIRFWFRIRKAFRDVSALFTDAIWTMDLSQSGRGWRNFVMFIKLARLTLETFARNRMGFQCVALSYFVMLAIVPLVAFIFAISGGLGLSDKIETIIYKIYPADPHMIELAIDKATNIIDIAQSGLVGIMSAMMFLWAILWMMFQVERVFNNVWGIQKIPRKIYKRFGFYILVLLLTPFLIILFGAGIAAYLNVTKLIGLDLSQITFVPTLLGWLGFYVLSACIMAMMFKYIPSAKVSFRYALKSAFLTAIVFGLFQYLYLETQVFVARLNTVYGVIAAIPLFLIWLNFSWQIIIYGAELTYSFQNVDSYKLPAPAWEDEK